MATVLGAVLRAFEIDNAVAQPALPRGVDAPATS